MKTESPIKNSGCAHRRQQFKNVPGSSLAVMYCLDCNWQKQISFDEAVLQIRSQN